MRNPLRVYMRHPALKPSGEVTAGQVDVALGRVRPAVPGERGDLTDLPPRPREIRQTQMPHVWVLDAGTPARTAIDRTTFDHVHGDTPAPRFRGDSDTTTRRAPS